MYNNSPVGKIFLQESTNGSCQLIRYFPTENQLFISWIRIYLYVHNFILILTNGDWKDHVQKLELILDKLKGKGLKCNIEYSFLVQTEIGYLVFWVTRNSVKPINRKIKAITNMKPLNS